MTTENDFMKLVGYVSCSNYRKKVLLTLATFNYIIPTVVAKKTGIRTNHISKVLSELKEKRLIVCINEEARKGRIYTTTTLGNDVAIYIKMHEEIGVS